MAEGGDPRRVLCVRGLTVLVVGCTLAIVAGCATTTAGTPHAAPSSRAEHEARGAATSTAPRTSGGSPAATLPVPIEFSLPDGWRSVPPREVDADVAFVALHPASRERGFTPNITIDGDVRDSGVPLTEVADERLAELRDARSDVRVEKSEKSGTADNPALMRVVRWTLVQNGKTLDIARVQAFLGFQDIGNPRRRAVLRFALTVRTQQLEQQVGDFQHFLSTVRPEGG
ncbi:hypothetical protein [Saccharomonospora iraqiensis]|uniref:hypothetical protein n=1 Tax=Saccharomonospora iraqiensis TaxID=52698 RepID=UPI00047BFEF2|nr:hypothetical protein [Saccharomonospora iraqiensis]